MASALPIIVTFLAIITPSLAAFTVNTSAIMDTLSVDFYKTKCPNAEKIVADVMKRNAQKEGTIPGIIRLHFHDCFVTGCDGSILLTPQKYNLFNSEKGYPSNGVSLRGMDVINEIKAEIEKQCPNVVSCADVLAYAAREATVLAGNPHYIIPAGRRDGLIVDGNLAAGLPKGTYNIELLTEMYAAKGLTLDDLVVLEGSHSIGRSRCQSTISDGNSIDNVTEAVTAVDKKFRAMVTKTYCPAEQSGFFWNLTTPLNPEKKDTAWGVSFYSYISKGQSVIPADIAMSVHSTTKPLVQQYAVNSDLWMKKFNEAMIKLGKMNVITGNQGEIRRHCGVMNAFNVPQ